jgi:cardiolipin synthase
MTVWLLLMIILPYIFIIFYYFFGVRKHSKKNEKNTINLEPRSKIPSSHPINKLTYAHNITPATDNNHLILYTDSQKAYFAFIQALEGAKSSIDLASFVVKSDQVTKVIFEILIKKAKEGVKIRFIIDALGSYPLYLWQRPLRELRRAGIEIDFFAPIFSLSNITKLNLRYHRKIFIIDNEILFSGGMNLSSEYIGGTFEQDRWLDLMFEARGLIVQSYVDVFNSDKAYINNEITIFPECSQSKAGNHTLQALPSGPDVVGDPLLEVILNSIYTAKKRIWIITPYFIPDEFILQALKIASHKGVSIKIITPRNSDHAIADFARSSYIRNIYEYDIDVVLYEGKMIHAKAMLFDDEMLILGSSNLDYRSLLLNYEIVTISYAQEHILEMQTWMESLINTHHTKLKPAGRIGRILENSARIFASQL